MRVKRSENHIHPLSTSSCDEQKFTREEDDILLFINIAIDVSVYDC
jgi:hypothetical protein